MEYPLLLSMFMLKIASEMSHLNPFGTLPSVLWICFYAPCTYQWFDSWRLWEYTSLKSTSRAKSTAGYMNRPKEWIFQKSCSDNVRNLSFRVFSCKAIGLKDLITAGHGFLGLDTIFSNADLLEHTLQRLAASRSSSRNKHRLWWYRPKDPRWASSKAFYTPQILHLLVERKPTPAWNWWNLQTGYCWNITGHISLQRWWRLWNENGLTLYFKEIITLDALCCTKVHLLNGTYLKCFGVSSC